MGQIVGAALVSHHPGLMQCEEFRRAMGAGEDSDLIAGYARLRQRIEAARPDVVLVFDSHWFTTGYHLVDAGARYRGTYVSDEMPWYLHGVPYDYRGLPMLAHAIEAVSREQGGFNRAIAHPDLGRQYATINLVKQLRLELSDTPVVSVSSCQNCEWPHFLKSGEAIGEAIRRSDLKVVLLASGALSHRVEAEAPASLPREQCVATREHRQRQGRHRADERGSARRHSRALERRVPQAALGGLRRALPADARRPGRRELQGEGRAAVGLRERARHRQHPYLVRSVRPR
jgi:aromatic ring-opening dioxygenase catalytic subunit (LigB family)